ncbi:unnamed protein product [Arctia plantaginis]|uniref:Elongation of very long chain fatty acids protein n=1 Tax=Arctia plantaginis TaxID=874455 RepID=A0A8S0Z580_ARCPL|nr:unnamed protein product [Arctia plantaginis]
MSAIINSVMETYTYLIHDLADPRTKDWWGVSNPLVIFSITSAYLYFCKYLGPRLMKHRKPFELKTVLLLYNLFQVFFSIFLTYEGMVYIFDKRYNYACEPIDYSNDPRAIRIAGGAWFYYIAKISELLDTVFFVLRKKLNQVSFLHVYHHTLMVLVIWFGVKYYAGGHIAVMGTLNSFVHVIMYTYYLISSLGPEYQKYVWWKKHVTVIQLVQFGIVFVHNFAVFFYKCDYPRILNVACSLNAVAFLYMFGKFYIQSYKRSSKSKIGLETQKEPLLKTQINKYEGKRKTAEKSR